MIIKIFGFTLIHFCHFSCKIAFCHLIVHIYVSRPEERISAHQIQQVFYRHYCVLYEFIYLFTYLLFNTRYN